MFRRTATKDRRLAPDPRQPVGHRQTSGGPARREEKPRSEGSSCSFRSYSEPGGIRDELIAVAKQHPRLTKLVSIGTTVPGQDVLAVKVTQNARQVRDGRRPSVLYVSAQHAPK